MNKARDLPPNNDDDDDFDGVTQEDIIEWVRQYVWSGEYDADEVVLLIEDQLGTDDELDEPWLQKQIRREFTAKRKAEKTWPKVTACDRLERAFEALEQQGLIALHMAGFTQSDGLDEVQEQYQEAGGKKSNYAGHCFYTTQDQEGSVYGGLWIGFGHLTGSDAKGVEVGRKVKAALEQEGFTVVWNETISTRLCVPDFRWQKRGPR